MDLRIFPGKLAGQTAAIPSKSQAHRLLICAALADGPTQLHCAQSNRDLDATAACLNALGAEVRATETGFSVRPMEHIPAKATLPCGESGSTLRFLLPLAAALGVEATFWLEGRLPQRPLSPLWEELERKGCQLSRPTPDTILCRGQLQPGSFRLSGSISSQYFTGLMLALPLLSGSSRLLVQGQLESKPYVDMTRQTLALFGVQADLGEIHGSQRYLSPGRVTVEGDWSNAAFFLTAQALGSPVSVTGLNPDSAQGDREIRKLLQSMETCSTISGAQIPDLIPILAVFAACRQGAVFTHIQRLRMKESDRVASTLAMIAALGGHGWADADTMTISGTGLTGGQVDAHNDHRIAMASAIAATCCTQPVILLDAQCVQKSDPHFWEVYAQLGGQYEQYLR